MWLIGYPGKQILEDRPDDATIDVAAYRKQWPGCVAVQFSGAYADLTRYGPEPTPADLTMTGGHDLRPFAMPTLAGEMLSNGIKAECSRRIYAHVTAEEQINMAAALPDASSDDATAIKEVRGWISAMRGASKALITSRDDGFVGDNKWPAWADSWTAVVAAY